VVAEALPQLQTLPDRPTGLSGTITTLGAPFIDPMSPIANKMTRRRKILNLVAWSLYSLFIGLCLYLLWELFDIYLFGYHSLKIDMRIHGGLVFFWLFVTIAVLFPGVLHFFRPDKTKVGWSEYWNAFAQQNSLRPFMYLCLAPWMKHGNSCTTCEIFRTL
jgi:hypothetical protein